MALMACVSVGNRKHLLIGMSDVEYVEVFN